MLIPRESELARGFAKKMSHDIESLRKRCRSGPPFIDLASHFKPRVFAFPQFGSTPLHYACSGGFYDTASFLLDHGADPQAADAVRGTPCCTERKNSDSTH